MNEVQEPRIIDSNATAAINVEDLFDEQRDRFDFYDAAAAAAMRNLYGAVTV